MVSGALLALVPVPDGRDDVVTTSLPEGSPLRVGISRHLPARSDLAAGRDQAERALHATSLLHPVNDLNRMSLLQVAAMQAPLQWTDVPEWVRQVLSDPRNRVEWESTGRALMEHGGSVSAAAKALSLHPNTVYYRLETIRSATGVDLRDARMLAELELAVLSRDFGVLVVPGESSRR